ncbi:MAG TPA: NRDE family protein [Candidatus Polarisedimenticolaceae bacterium]|nr:NRDE family protein [Candidatus Polarisedimenticolaceae bacterium]
MCTVAFVPLSTGGYLLGHNRDERPTRRAGEAPRLLEGARCRAIAPRDPDAGGTWIALNEAGVTVCVLNAAEASPARLPSKPRSRGLLVRDLACVRGIDDARVWLEEAREVLDWTRAFHLVAVEPGSRTGRARVARFRWDGLEADWENGDGPTLFVSSLLQPTEVERERSARWRTRAEAGPIDAGGLAAFLAGHEPVRGPLSVCMHRDQAGTVSRTLVEVTRSTAVMRYLPGPPCQAGTEVEARLPLSPASSRSTG